MGRLTDVTLDGSRLEQLSQLAVMLAQQLDSGDTEHSIAQIARQYRETIAEIEFLSGRADDDAEIDALLD